MLPVLIVKMTRNSLKFTQEGDSIWLTPCLILYSFCFKSIRT